MTISMTDEQRAAYAIGYLRGISAILWNLDHDVSSDEAAHYDEQVNVLAKLVMKEDGDRYERVRECELEHHDTGWVSCRECNASWKNDRPHVYRRCPYCGARVKKEGGDD